MAEVDAEADAFADKVKLTPGLMEAIVTLVGITLDVPSVPTYIPVNRPFVLDVVTTLLPAVVVIFSPDTKDS